MPEALNAALSCFRVGNEPCGGCYIEASGQFRSDLPTVTADAECIGLLGLLLREISFKFFELLVARRGNSFTPINNHFLVWTAFGNYQNVVGAMLHDSSKLDEIPGVCLIENTRRLPISQDGSNEEE